MKKLDIKDYILFENEDYLVINKPSGVSTLEDKVKEINILSMAKSLSLSLQTCHRLDKDTSGALVLAKNPEGYKHLSLQFQNRKVEKYYHAIVHGGTGFKNELINLPLIVKGKGIVKWDSKSGKESRTYFTTLKNYNNYSLVDCKPITGRRHQIRIHLKYKNHPILADTLYGGEYLYLSNIKKNYKSKERTENPIISRTALHARSISFQSLDGDTIKVEAPYPKDFSVLLKQLEKFGK